ncbi:MAG TPA: hypothetical protein VJ603_00775 [Paucimonas sp.]|nr:hypothetical protein [Paucimonas sp.]
MEDSDFNELAGRDDAVFRTLVLLIRQLHVKGIIEAPDLVQEMRLLAEQLDPLIPQQSECIAGMEGIATAIEGEQSRWTEARMVADLYRAGPDRDR